MEQITRKEVIGLLRNFQQRMAAKRGMCDEHDGALWDNAEAVIASLQAAEPVGEIDEDDDGYFVELYPDRSFKLGQKVFSLPCPPDKSQARGEPYGYVYDGQLLCDEQDFADYFDGAQYDISTMTPVYTAPPAPAAVPEGWQTGHENWPVIGGVYLVSLNGIVQHETYTFDQGDDGDGTGGYFWSRDDVDDCPEFNPDDAWLRIDTLASPQPAETEEKTSEKH